MDLTKRDISILEKKELTSLNGFCLVFLGSNCPEIPELIDAGFNPRRIIGIDWSREKNDQSVANIKYCEKNYKGVRCFNVPFERFYRNYGFRFKYSYIHLDFCSHMTSKILDQCVLPIDALLPGGRLRITFSESAERLSVARGDFYLYEQFHQNFAKLSNCRLELKRTIRYISTESHSQPFRTVYYERV